MKKTILFITDLYGTFFANENMYIRDLETKKLILNLEKLRILHHADDIVFEFVTSQSKEVLAIFVNEFSHYISDTKITLGKQMCKDGTFYKVDDHFVFESNQNSKVSQVREEILENCQNYQVVAVYYADDTLWYHDILLKEMKEEMNLLVPSMVPDYNQQLITSKYMALEGINECLNKKIKTFGKKQ